MLIGIIFATVISAVYAFLCLRADDKVMESLNKTQLLMQTEKVEELELQMTDMVEQFQENAESMTPAQIKRFKKKANILKKRKDEADKILANFQAGKYGVFDIVSLAGYSAIDFLGWDINSPVIKSLITKCQQLKKKDVAVMYSFYLVAQMIALAMIGGIVGFAMLSVGIANELGTRSLVVFIVPMALCIIIGYLPLDKVNSEVKLRKESIEKDFPQVISKLALLTSAGLEVNRAWKLVMDSGEGVLYKEMQAVTRDLTNNVPSGQAYQKMRIKCNDKYVTKLTSAITQNNTKGNADIVKYFRELNDESWMERKHSSRRMAEKVQSKLLVPTLLMFGGILILVIVPVMSGFNMF